jgi:hypothetical protein
MVLLRGEMTTNDDLGASTQNGSPPVVMMDTGQRAHVSTRPDLPPLRESRKIRLRARWEIRFAKAIAMADFLAMASLLRLHKWWGDPSGYDGRVAFDLIMMAPTGLAICLARARDPSVLGQGSQKISRLLSASVVLALTLGLVGLVLKFPLVRPNVCGVVAVAFILGAIGPLMLRKVLHRGYRNGTCLHEVLVVGPEDAVVKDMARTRQVRHHWWMVTRACTPSGAGTDGGPPGVHVN